jgi:hypothetical protein
MKSLRLGIAIAWGALAGAGCGCAQEAEGSTVSELTQLEPASDPDWTGGGAGQGAAEDELEARGTEGSIEGLDGNDLIGLVGVAPGAQWSGEIELACCRDGSYSVYLYEGGRCSDPETWDVERSARVAEIACANDVGSAAYARDPSDASTTAFVIYDATGNAIGCADVAAE